MINLPNVIYKQTKPSTLVLRLKCESKRDASGVRQSIIVLLKDYKYQRKDFKFEIVEEKE